MFGETIGDCPSALKCECRIDAQCRQLYNVGIGKVSCNALHPTAWIPRVATLLALAHRFEKLVETGVAADFADLARFGHVSRAPAMQIVNLLSLVLDIQIHDFSFFLSCHRYISELTVRGGRESVR